MKVQRILKIYRSYLSVQNQLVNRRISKMMKLESQLENSKVMDCSITKKGWARCYKRLKNNWKRKKIRKTQLDKKMKKTLVFQNLALRNPLNRSKLLLQNLKNKKIKKILRWNRNKKLQYRKKITLCKKMNKWLI